MNTQELKAIGERLRTQDNRITQNPMFCVQKKVRDVGYDPAFTGNSCWHNSDLEEEIYDDDPGFKEPPTGDGWREFGYRDRWETVMVAFTEKGCERYLELDGHNVRRTAHNGEVRIYVESFNRCEEMIAIRDSLIKQGESKGGNIACLKCNDGSTPLYCLNCAEEILKD